MTRRNLFSFLGKSVVAGAAAAVASQLPAEAKADGGYDPMPASLELKPQTIGYFNVPHPTAAAGIMTSYTLTHTDLTRFTCNHGCAPSLPTTTIGCTSWKRRKGLFG